ncbi:MAG: 50S ribosomal protein L24e [archaeon]|nr:50S ribosomal protein L24e [archaeon]
MVETRKCSFCYRDIEPGTGKMFVKKDGAVLNFCTSKCYKNMVKLRRIPRTVAWTDKAKSEKAARTKTVEKKE